MTAAKTIIKSVRRRVRANPSLRAANIARHRVFRHISGWLDRKRYASRKIKAGIWYRVHRHHSLLYRRLGDSDPALQVSKARNLALAAKEFDGLVIRPGETFSYWKTLGMPTAARGYLPGLLLSHGEVSSGVGGGLCQLSNLLYWMFLHSPLTITERYRHSFDPFPDDGRILPFGSGATVFYNYVDLCARNDSDTTFQLRIWVDDTKLHGELHSNTKVVHAYTLFEREHAYCRNAANGTLYRRNEIWRTVRRRDTGVQLREERVIANFSEVKYSPQPGTKIAVIADAEARHLIRSEIGNVRHAHDR